MTYRLKADDEHLETIERVHEMHADFCPVYRTLKPAFEITTSYELV